MKPEIELRFKLHAQTAGFSRRMGLARQRIGEWLPLVERPYVAFSTGKDSTVTLALVREQVPDTPAVYLDADSSFPESREMLRRTENVVVYETDEPILDTLERHGLDGGVDLDRATMQSTVWGPIQRLVAEYAFDGVALGLRTEESHGRRMNAYVRGSVYQYRRDGLWACQPLWDWSYNDVWAAIVTLELDYCGVYDRMWDMPEADQRLSYWAGETKRRWGRYAWLKRNYPELFNELAARIPEARAYV